jgi:hypothetical protein
MWLSFKAQLMRELTRCLTILILVFHSFGTARAQSEPNEVIAKLERAMKAMEPAWRCVSVAIPQGEPGPDSPRGTKYQFRCHRRSVTIAIFILYGESKQDAEKALTFSQRLQVNDSRPVEGIGEQAYELARDSFAWITFRNGNVYGQVNVGITNARETDDTSENQSITANALVDAAKLFARLVVEHIPAT